MKIHVPKTYTNEMEVKVAINQSIENIMVEMLKKYHVKKIRKEKPGDILVASVTVGTKIGILDL